MDRTADPLAVEFDTRAYLEEFFGLRDGQLSFDARLLLHYCAKLVRRHKLCGIEVLSLGSGPSLTEVISLATVAREIHMSDISASNRRALERFDAPSEDGFDWRPLVAQAIAEERQAGTDMLDGGAYAAVEPEAVEARLATLKSRITKVLASDATRRDPLHGEGRTDYDLVISLFCIDAASRDLESWHGCLENLTGLVRPGGLLVFGTSLESSSYRFGEQVHGSAFVTEATLWTAITAHGFELVEPEPARFVEQNPDRLYSGGLYLTARKGGDADRSQH